MVHRVAAFSIVLLFAATLFAADPDSRLLDAVKRGDHAALRTLIQQGLDVNVPQVDGASALAWAADRDDLEAAQLLIQAGARANSANEYGATPLWLACAKGSMEMTKLLLEAGADANGRLRTGESSLMTAIDTGSLEVVQLLLAHGADVNSVAPNSGQTPLMWAVADDRVEIAKALLARHADANARTPNGFTPLHFAAQQGSLELAQVLLASGAGVDGNSEQSSTAPTPLLIASASGHQEISTFLVTRGASVVASDEKGFTPLHHAAMRRNLLPLLTALLSHGANPNIRMPHDAPEQGGVSEMTIEGATPVFLAAAAGNVAAVKQLAAAGGNINIATAQGTTPLMVAAGLGVFENRRDDLSKSALETAKLLVELGADVNARGEHGWSALHGAAYTGSNDILEFLVKSGARTDVIDGFGQTPLSIALAVVTPGVVNDAYKRARAYRRSTADLLVRLGAPSLEASGVHVIQSLPEDFSPVLTTESAATK